jgi:hypothetical protein
MTRNFEQNRQWHSTKWHRRTRLQLNVLFFS